MWGVTGYSTYVPAGRLERSSIASALGGAVGKGTRSVASFDEDTTSLAVEAARGVLAGGARPDGVLFATTAPAYLDKTNATAVHAALDLDFSTPAYDMVGSMRSGIGAVRAGLDAAAAGRNLLAVMAEVRTGQPGSADEMNGGDGAAAFTFGRDRVIAEFVGAASGTEEFVDRWRLPADVGSRAWEERFGETVYSSMAEPVIADACKQAGVTEGDLDHIIVSSLHARAARRVGGALRSSSPAVVADDLSSIIGNTGCAQPGILLADVLDRAQPGELIMLVTLADGVDVLVLRATEALSDYRRERRTVREQIEAGVMPVSYAAFMTWRGIMRREPPRRPDPDRPSAPPSFRSDRWKMAFVGSRCTRCGTRHMPPGRVCFGCGSVDEMSPEALADVPATVVTFTIDRLAYSLNPPVVAVVIDFDGGGRFQCELTDVDPDEVAIGDRVEMTFRRLFTADGVHNYFWKARPRRTSEGSEG